MFGSNGRTTPERSQFSEWRFTGPVGRVPPGLYPQGGIALDAEGNVDIADTGNQCVPRVIHGLITTIAGMRGAVVVRPVVLIGTSAASR